MMPFKSALSYALRSLNSRERFAGSPARLEKSVEFGTIRVFGSEWRIPPDFLSDMRCGILENTDSRIYDVGSSNIAPVIPLMTNTPFFDGYSTRHCGGWISESG